MSETTELKQADAFSADSGKWIAKSGKIRITAYFEGSDLIIEIKGSIFIFSFYKKFVIKNIFKNK